MTTPLLTVKVGPHTFGAPTTTVTEILGHTNLTPLPRTPAVVAGVAVVRGQPLAVLSMRPLLHLAPNPAFLSLRWQTETGVVLLAVDEVESLVDPGPELPAEAWTGLVPASLIPLVSAAHRHGDGWLWAWPPDLPDRLLRQLQTGTAEPRPSRSEQLALV
jgi:purine-binding chemotaxis protein CheW